MLRHPNLAVRSFRIVVLACLLLVISACAPHIPLPGANLSPTYVINRSGDLYLGTRCSTNLIRVDAQWSDQVDVTQQWPSPEKTLWAARAEGAGVIEFLLFRSGQVGVMVTIDHFVEDSSRDIQLTVEDSDGHISYEGLAIGDLDPGMVGPGSTGSSMEMTWQQYKDMDESLYGCKTVWGGR